MATRVVRTLVAKTRSGRRAWRREGGTHVGRARSQRSVGGGSTRTWTHGAATGMMRAEPGLLVALMQRSTPPD